MSPRVLRTKTPPGEPSTSVNDVTEPQFAPLVRSAAASLPVPPAVRSRKATLVSPIPALLAASMGLVREEGEAAPVPAEPAADATWRVDASDADPLVADDDAEYVVEVVDSLHLPRK